MTASAFFDSNIFLYAVSEHPDDIAKKQIARDLIREVPFLVSTQVLQEFIAVALNKPRLNVSEAGIDAFIELFVPEQVVPMSLEIVTRSLEIRRKWKLSHWDASIIGAALQSGCNILYSEDLQHQQKIETPQIKNPFRRL